MIRITEFKKSIDIEGKALEAALRKELGISELHPMTYRIIRRSLDARRQGGANLFSFVYTVDVTLAKEDKVWKHANPRQKAHWQQMDRTPAYEAPYEAFRQGTAGSATSSIAGSADRSDDRIACTKASSVPKLPAHRPIVVGLGPSGLFCALLLARAGLEPLIIERGRPVEQRKADTLLFFKNGILDENSNVQFGEGGAGAFSDGKLNTLIKDPTQRGQFVMEEFVKAGAPEEILYDAKPHVGTDRLQIVVKNMREELLSLGAEILFETRLTGLRTGFGPGGTPRLQAAVLTDRNGHETTMETSALFLGIGHSARDTFAMLVQAGLVMEEKAFAMGVRIEHPRAMIDQDQFREYAGHPALGSASYKLAYHASNGRGLYTFCMCPGGKVIASASEKNSVVTNGMSNYARDEVNSNSALLISITPEDFAPYREEGGVLSGVLLQRELEQKAFVLGGSDYKAPVQTVGDFLADRPTTEASFGEVEPSYTGGTRGANLREILPDYMTETLAEGLAQGGPFGRKIHGFDRPDAILTGVESRSSSPVRILRGEDAQSSVKGLFPMGEGAGYAGGITSAAIDGMKAAEVYLKSLSQR